MLMPKKTKFRKQMRGRMKGDAHTGNKISFGSIGLQAIGRGYVTTRQIEAARRVITRTLKRGGKTWIGCFLTSRLQNDLLKQEWGRARELSTLG